MSALAETIEQQGELLAGTLALDLDRALAALEPARRIWLVGTGTSQHAAELGCLLFGPGPRELRWHSSAGFAARPELLREGDAVVVISHTAETAFSRSSRQLALERGLPTLSITGQGRGWAEAIETVPRERSETYTASYTAALAVLGRLAVGLDQAGFETGLLEELPDRVRTATAAGPPAVDEPERLLALAGSGPAAITAREGALKLREAARVLAEGFESEYLLHGSAVPLGPGDGLLVVDPAGDGSGLTTAIAAAAGNEGIAVSELSEASELGPVLAQIPLTVRLQALAAEWAERRGVDPDHVIAGAWADEALWEAGAPPG